jgi:hypothetical protein
MAQEEYDKMSTSEKKKEDWMNSKWRPMMGWIYMGTCFCDFVLFPILWSLLQAVLKQPVSQWQPLTLQGAGLYHIAMGAVLGIAAMGRTQEKLAGANNGGANISSSVPPTSSLPSPAAISPAGIGAGAIGSISPAVKPTPAIPKPTPAASQLNDDLHPDDPPVRNTRND